MQKHWQRLILVFAILLALAPPYRRAAADEGPFAWQAKMADRVASTAMSADGSMIVYGSRSGEVWITKPSGETVARWQAPNAVSAVAMTGDGSRIAVVSDNQQLFLLDVAAKTVWDAPINGSGVSVAVTADGSRVAAGTWDGAIQAFDNKGSPLWQQVASDRVYALAYAGGGHALVSGTRRGIVSLWDDQGNEQWTVQSDTAVRSIAVSQNGELIVAGNEAGLVYILDARGAVSVQKAIAARTLRAIAMDTTGSHIALASDDGQLYVIDPTGQILLQQTVCASLSAVSISANGQRLSVGCGDGTAGILNLTSAQQTQASTQRTRQLTLIGAVLALAAVIAATLYLLRATAAGRRRTQGWHRLVRTVWQHRVAYFLIIPSLTLLIVFSYYPAFSAVFHAFTKWSPGLSTEYIGLENFRKAFSDSYLWVGLANLVILLIAAMLKVTIMPLVAAELVFHLRHEQARYGYRILYVLPMVVPAMVETLLWRMIYNPEIGLINQTLNLFGLAEWARPWLGSAQTALGAIVFMGFPWVGTIAFLIYYAALMEIPDETIDAAKIDGATGALRIRYIDIPQIAPKIGLMVLLAYIGRMQGFQDILVLTGGGPASATYVPALEMYYAAFRFGDFGYASAIAMMLFVVILFFTLIGRRQPRQA